MDIKKNCCCCYYNTGVWPSGCLIAPYYGKLTPEVGAPAAAIKSAADPAGNEGANEGSSAST
jgi:hypothetical protein